MLNHQTKHLETPVALELVEHQGWQRGTTENAGVEKAGSDSKGWKCSSMASRMKSRTDIIYWETLKLLPKICPQTSEWIEWL